nr:pectinesterase family protein [Micromonospora sp. DSM 115978]
MKVTTGRRRAASTVAAAVATTTVLAGAVLITPAQAAAGCRVDYRVASQWPGGFNGDVTVTNLGDPINGWRLTWTFAAGQQVTQAWNASIASGTSSITATNVSYNGSIATNGSVNFGFNGSWTGSNPVPTNFALNGTACTGAVAPTTVTPTTPAPTTPAPTTPAPTTPPPSGSPTVAADGTGTYRTVQAAINAVPTNNTTRRVITIKAGTYREVITVPANKPHITLLGLGSSPSNVLLVYNNSAGTHGTSGSASMFAYGAGFVAENLTISNDFDENSAASGHQAVALHLNADRAILRNVRLLGDQDTFLVNDNTRAYVVNSYIEGTVDFIFGGGTIVFDTCRIYEKRSTGGPITAASTPATKTYGMLFYRSTITGAANNVTTLGRPWRPDAQVLYRESSLSATIRNSQPWTDMSTNTWQNARFLEYRNTGSGATTNGNRPQLSDSQAANYTPQRYLAGTDGWNPM